MAIIPLRTYLQEIQRMIDRQRLDEAIAHARHILLFYPRYIDVYRLLGKAYLDANRYGDAADIFQRVLSSLPEDYISNAGMSIIREDEGNMDEAIWHMERAFEIEPSNSAIQDEFRRLIGRRDGIEPPKIRLTRGALARMYLKGDLIQEAIKEIRIALTEDNDRLDLKALLVVALHRAGQRVEAIDAARQVLKKLPNNLDANRIMAELLAGTDKDEEAQEYRRVVIGLNPYYNFVTPSTPLPEQVPSQAISLEKLDWKTDEIQPGAQVRAAWATSLGIDITEPGGKKVTVPDSETTSREVFSQAQTPAADEIRGITTAPDQSTRVEFPSEKFVLPGEHTDQEPEEELPEWMRQAGWDSTSEKEQLPVAGDSEINPDEVGGFGLSDQELPVWLTESEAAAEPQATESIQPEQELPAWLTESEVEAEPQATESIQSEQELPAWLTESEVEAEPQATESIQPEQELPAWLTESEAESEPQATESIQPEQELPDWLAESEAEAESQATESIQPEQELPAWLTESEAEAEPQATESIQPEQELPDWLTESEVEAEPQATESIQPEQELPAWLAESEAAAEPPATESIQPEQELPAWLTESEAEAEPQATESIQPEQELPAWLTESEVETEPQATESIQPEQELPAWLAESEAAAEPQATESIQPEQELPAWLAESEAEAEPQATESIQPEQELPDWLTESEEEAEPQATESIQPEQELPDWLAESEAEVESQATESIQPEQEFPDWLSERREESAPKLETEPYEATSAEALPEWVFESESVVSPENQLPPWLTEPLAIAESDRSDGETVQPDAGANLPSWLFVEEVSSAEENDVRSEIPDWLMGESSVETPASEAVDQIAETQAEEIPDWLFEEIQPAAPEPSSQLEGMPEERFTSQAGESPELFTRPAEFVAQPGSTEGTLTSAIPSEREIESAAVPEPSGEQTKTTIKLPAWLLEGQTTQEEPAYSEPQELIIPGQAGFEMPQDAAETPTEISQEEQIPAWLLDEDVSLEDSAKTERLPVEPPAPVEEELPEWLAMLAETPLEEDDTKPSKVKKPAEIIQPAIEIPEETAVEALDGEQTATPHWLLEALEDQQEIQPDLSFDFTEPAEMAGEHETEAEALGCENESFSEWQLEEDIDARLEGAAGPHLTKETQLAAAVTQEPQESEFSEGETPALPEQYDVAPVESLESLRAEIMSQELLEEAEGSEEPLEMPEETPDEPSAKERPLEMPEWLVEPVEEPGSDFEWTPPPVPPSEFVNLNSGTLVEFEKIPGIGFIRAQNIINYRENNGPFSDIEQLAQVPGMTADLIDSLKDYVYIEESIEEQPVAAVEVEVPVFEKSLPDELQNARSALGEDDITAAIQNYSTLIESNQYLPEIIQDLQEARDRHPDNPDIWLSLGDAYIRANQVQNALSAYREAERLLL